MRPCSIGFAKQCSGLLLSSVNDPRSIWVFTACLFEQKWIFLCLTCDKEIGR